MAQPAPQWWYAIKNYNAGSEEQLTVIAGEPLHVVDDSDNEWWYCVSPRTELAGYIPALFVEVIVYFILFIYLLLIQLLFFVFCFLYYERDCFFKVSFY